MPAPTRAGGAVTVRPAVKIGPVGRRLAAILGHYPRKGAIYITSAFRPEERGSHHGGLSYGGSPTAAIDIDGGGVNPTVWVGLTERRPVHHPDAAQLLRVAEPIRHGAPAP